MVFPRKARSLLLLAMCFTFFTMQLNPDGIDSKRRPFLIQKLIQNGGLILRNDNLGIRMFAMVGSRWQSLSHRSTVTLCTQGNLDYLGDLPILASRWQGPMSIAIYVPGMEWNLARFFVEHLQECFPEIASRIAFHFVFPLSQFPLNSIKRPNVGCISKRAWLKLILSYRTSQHVKFIANDSYPYNIMRNVARDGAVTEFVLMSDIDHVPNEGIFDTLEDFLAQDKVYYARKLAYVIPQYELNLTKVVQIPSDKAELLELEKKKLAAPMYQDYFPQFQHCVKPKLWESINETHVDQYLAMQVNFTFSCEMTLVHKARDPYFDERFRGYGFDRFSQMLELHVAKFRFYAFTSLFFVHLGRKGIQDTKGHSPKKLAELRQNQKRMIPFIKSLDEKYHVKTCQILVKERAWMGHDIPWVIEQVCPELKVNQTQH